MNVVLRRTVALSCGLLTHGGFAIAVAAMAVGLWTGLERPLLPAPGGAAWNAFLVLQFPLLHSFLLSARGGKVLAKLWPFGLGRTLAPSSFVIVSSLQILAVFATWSPSGVRLFEVTGPARLVCAGGYAAGWILLARSMQEAGLPVQSGSLGWTSLWHGRRLVFRAPPQHGLHAFSRHPIYLSFALLLWTPPVLTLDRLVLALSWTLYCVAGPLLKERRWASRDPVALAAHRATTPYFLPRLPRFRPPTQDLGCGSGPLSR